MNGEDFKYCVLGTTDVQTTLHLREIIEENYQKLFMALKQETGQGMET